MSCYGGPEITNDGLVLYYDMNNTQKSWKGAPTTNLLASPSDFTNASWLKISSSVASNMTTAPDGTLTADTWIEDTSAATQKYMRTPVSTVVAGTYTMSCFVKAASGTRYFVMEFYDSTSPAVYRSFFNVSNGTVTFNYNGAVGSTVPYGNGWYRCIMTATVTSTVSSYFYISNSSTGVTGYTGDGTSGLYIWGAQLETGSFATPLVTGSRTNTQALLDLTNSNTLTATSLTYASDNTFSFNGTSNYVDVANTSSLQFLGTLPYTLEAWVYPTANPGVNNWTGIFNREYNVGLGRDGYNMYFLGSAGTSTQVTSERWCSGVQTVTYITLDQSVSVNNWSYLVATYDGSNLKLYRNGTLQSSIASANNITNATTNLTIGKRDTNYFNGKISLAKVYNTALSADQVKQNFNATRGRYGI